MADREQESDGGGGGDDGGTVHIVIETENVIDAVRSHRLLWDPQHDLYTAKEARRRTWTDICRTLITDWDKFDYQDQNDIERKVQQRWRTARDCFVKARAAAGGGGARRATRRDNVLRSYSHYGRLAFLEETLRAPPGAVTVPAGARRARRRHAPPSPPPLPQAHPVNDSENGSLSVFERRLLATLRERERGDSPLEADDEHFFRSLGPMLAVLDHRQKLQFRSAVLDVLQRQYRDTLEPYDYVAVDERRVDDDDEPPAPAPAPDVKYDPAASPAPLSPLDTPDH